MGNGCRQGVKMSDTSDLRERLVALLEAERAGVDVANRMLAVSGSDEETELLEEILGGEKVSCKALGHILVDLGLADSGKVGDFGDKVMALEDKTDRLNMLIKGQAWVVRKLDEVLALDLDVAIRKQLKEVKRVHDINIDKCRQFVG
jgi:nitronate monooxygenase